MDILDESWFFTKIQHVLAEALIIPHSSHGKPARRETQVVLAHCQL